MTRSSSRLFEAPHAGTMATQMLELTQLQRPRDLFGKRYVVVACVCGRCPAWTILEADHSGLEVVLREIGQA